MEELERDIHRQTPAEKARARAEHRKLKKDEIGLHYILADERGRWFLMRLFEQCHMLDTTFPDEDHTNRMLIFEGERRVAVNILDQIARGKELDSKLLAEKEYYDFFYEMDRLVAAADIERKE